MRPAHCPQHRPRRLPLLLRSAVLGRSDASSSKGLEYRLPMTRERGVGSGTGASRDQHLRTPHSIATPFHPSPAPALQPQQPLHHPSAAPCARRPPAPPAVLMRRGLCTSQGCTERVLRVRASSWRLRIRALRAAHARLCLFACIRVVSVWFARVGVAIRAVAAQEMLAR